MLQANTQLAFCFRAPISTAPDAHRNRMDHIKANRHFHLIKYRCLVNNPKRNTKHGALLEAVCHLPDFQLFPMQTLLRHLTWPNTFFLNPPPSVLGSWLSGLNESLFCGISTNCSKLLVSAKAAWEKRVNYYYTWNSAPASGTLSALSYYTFTLNCDKEPPLIHVFIRMQSLSSWIMGATVSIPEGSLRRWVQQRLYNVFIGYYTTRKNNHRTRWLPWDACAHLYDVKLKAIFGKHEM